MMGDAKNQNQNLNEEQEEGLYNGPRWVLDCETMVAV